MKRLVSACLMVLIVLLTATGCGVDETSLPSTSRQVPVKLGVALPLTGNYAEYGLVMKAAVELALQDYTQSHTENLVQMELVVRDTKADVHIATEIAREFSADPDIVAVITDFSSTCSLAVAPIYQEAGLTQLSPTTAHPEFSAIGDYVFGYGGRQADETGFIVNQILQETLGAASTGILYLNNDWGVSGTGLLSTACYEAGIQVTAKESIISGERDFTRALQKIRQTAPDVLVLMLPQNECVAAMAQLTQMGWEIQLVTPEVAYTPALLGYGGENLEGLVASTPYYFDERDARSVAFSDKIQQMTGIRPGFSGVAAYDGARALLSAIGPLQSISRQSVRDAFANSSNGQALGEALRFSSSGDVQRNYHIVTVVHGDWIAITEKTTP